MVTGGYVGGSLGFYAFVFVVMSIGRSSHPPIYPNTRPTCLPTHLPTLPVPGSPRTRWYLYPSLVSLMGRRLLRDAPNWLARGSVSNRQIPKVKLNGTLQTSRGRVKSNKILGIPWKSFEIQYIPFGTNSVGPNWHPQATRNLLKSNEILGNHLKSFGKIH